MNKKVVKSILSKKVTQWLESINDEKVKVLAAKNTIITGGSIASLLLNEEVNDFDVYFRNKETTLAVAKYYVNAFNAAHVNKKNKLGGNAKAYVLDGEFVKNGKLSEKADPEIIKEFVNQGTALTRMIAGCTPDRVKIIVRSDGVAAADDYEEILNEPFENVVEAIAVKTVNDADAMNGNALDEAEEARPPYRPVFLSTNAITLSDKMQLVVRFYGEPDQIHENYDFVHCTNYYDHGKHELVLRQEALECLLNKELKYVGSKYPLCSVIRTRKFIKRGFHINAGQYLKMCFQISQLDLTNIDTLEDQLVGVDSAYFMALINGLRSKQESDVNFKVEENYVTSIIDRIF